MWDKVSKRKATRVQSKWATANQTSDHLVWEFLAIGSSFTDHALGWNKSHPHTSECRGHYHFGGFLAFRAAEAKARTNWYSASVTLRLPTEIKNIMQTECNKQLQPFPEALQPFPEALQPCPEALQPCPEVLDQLQDHPGNAGRSCIYRTTNKNMFRLLANNGWSRPSMPSALMENDDGKHHATSWFSQLGNSAAYVNGLSNASSSQLCAGNMLQWLICIYPPMKLHGGTPVVVLL